MKSQDLLKQYPFALETHAHTAPVSRCAQVSPADTVAIHKAIGVHALVITNHFTADLLDGRPDGDIVDEFLKDFYDAEKAGDALGVKVILGAEFRFADNGNDYLVYGVDRDFLLKSVPYLKGDFASFSKAFRCEKRLILQAHPKRWGMTDMTPELLDGVETFNFSKSHNSYVCDAVAMALQNPAWINVCGSDFHYEGGEGRILLRTKRLPCDSFDLVNLLREGDYIFSAGGGAVILP